MSTQAVRAEDFANSIGINTHLDFNVTAYNNVSVVESALTYLGVRQVRDAMQFPSSAALFGEVAAATGVKYDLFLAPGSEADLAGELRNLQQLPASDIQLIEGRNEADLYGPGFQQGIADQVTLYQFVQQNLPGIPVIQESFAGLPDYGNAGDQSAYADYGNAHTYFGTGNNPALGNWIGVLNADALEATPGKPVIITEAGYYTTGSTTDPHSVDVAVQAKYTLDLVFDSFQVGDVKTYLYELLDQKSSDGSSEDNFGLFYSDGTPKPAATAIRDLLTLLADPGSSASSFPQGSMTYSLSGLPSGGNSFLMEKSDGSYWLAVWDDTRLSGPVTPTDITIPPVPVSINFGFTANIEVFDPLNGTTVIQTADGVTNVTISLPDHPVLVEILPVSGSTTAPPVDPPPGDIVEPSFTVPGGETAAEKQTIAVTGIQFDDSAAANAAGALSLNVSSNVGNFTMTDGAGNVLTGSVTTSIFVQGALAQLNADLATLSYTAGANAGPDQLGVTVTDQSGNTFSVAVQVSVTATGGGAPPPPSGPSITAPGTETVATGQMLSVTGVQIVDSYAANDPGQLALNVSSSGGNIAMTDGSGTTLAGSGSPNISVQGTLTQINADLASLTFTAGAAAGGGQISVQVYDQLGLSTNLTIPVSVTASSTGGGTSPGPSITTPAPTTVAASQTLPISGVRVVDSYAASDPGSMALNVASTGGNIAMTDGGGTALAGSGSTDIFVQGTFAQINADLATLSYTAGATTGAGQIRVEVYDQLGLSSNATLPVSITAASAPTGPTITGTSGDDNIVATINNTTINSGAGNDSIFLSGTGDVVTTGNGTNTVMGFVGGNTITTGSGNDVIRIGGTGSVVNAGLGDNTISDSGNGNTFVLPTTGGTDDIFGYVLQNSDMFDLRPLLAATTWNGSQSTLANYLQTTASSDGANTMLVVTPSGGTTGNSYTAATFNGSGVISLPTLLSHSLA
jgi:serralysin